MFGWTVNLLGLRIFISCIGLVGNVFLILAIIHTKFSPLKTFELFLLGLAAANMEEIVIANIYDIIIFQMSTTGTWLCHSLKFLTMFGKITSIFFTVIISIFRYQKLRDADHRVNLPVCLDSIRAALMVSGVCVMLSMLLSLPIFVISLQGPWKNDTRSSGGCHPDYFECSKNDCPVLNHFYKYLFILVCNLLPLIIVTVTSCHIIIVLLSQRKTVTPEVGVSGPSQFGRKSKGLWLQRSMISVLAALALFQADWTTYLIFQLTFRPTDSPVWAESEFLIATTYASISPYVYGIGDNLFSLKNFLKK